MKIEKRGWLLFFIGLCIVTFAVGAMPLTNPILKFLDGIKFAIDGTTIWEMMIIRHGIKKIQYGVLDKETGSYGGMYLFQGIYHSLHSLAELARALEEERAQQKSQLEQQFIDAQARVACLEELTTMTTTLEEKFLQDCDEQLCVIERTLEQDESIVDEQILMQESLYRSYQHEIQHQEELIIQKYITNQEAYHDAYMRVQQEYEDTEKDLARVFTRVKHDVLNVLAPFRKKMALAKKFLHQLVYEFCRKHKLSSSFLLHWTTIADGHEFVIFNRTMTDCKILDAFCCDLTSFLKDVIESCPKGWQQFLELSKTKNEF
jgi:hypothetical protein